MDTDGFKVYIKAEDIYIDIVHKMLKQDLIPQIMNQIDHYLQEKNKKAIGLMKDVLGVTKDRACGIEIKNILIEI